MKTCEENAVHLIIEEGFEAYLPLANLVDKEKEISRLTKQADKLRKEISGLTSRLSSKGFIDKAPDNVIIEVKNNIRDKVEQLTTIEKTLQDLN